MAHNLSKTPASVSHIGSSPDERVSFVIKQAKAHVAFATKQATDFFGLMAVVNMGLDSKGLLADRARIALAFQTPVVFLSGNAIASKALVLTPAHGVILDHPCATPANVFPSIRGQHNSFVNINRPADRTSCAFAGSV